MIDSAVNTIRAVWNKSGLGQRRIGEKRDRSFTVFRSSCAARKPIGLFTVKLQHGIQLMTNIRIVSCFGLFSGVLV